jgi:general secretion pathway protein D
MLIAAPSKSTITTPKAYFDKTIEQIEFREITVGDALRILSEESNINIVASKQASDIVVTMFLRKVTAIEVIDAISKTYNLSYQYDEKSNFIRLYTVQEYRLEQVEFKQEETEVFTMKNAKNALDLAETIQNLFSTRVRLSYGQNQQQLMNDLQQRFARFDLVDGRTKQNFNIGGTGGNTQNQQGGNQQQQGTNQQFGNQQGANQFSNQSNNSGQNNQNGQNSTKQLDDRLNAITNVIGKLDANGQDGKNGGGIKDMLIGNTNESREFVDSSVNRQAPIYVGVIKHQNRVLVRTRDVDAMNEIKKINKRLDVESSMLLMEVKVLSIDLSDGYSSLFDFKLKNGNAKVAEGGATSIDDAVSGALKSASAVFDPTFLATAVSNSFEARLQLLEKENRVTEIATPMLLTSNQEVSRFLVGSTIPVLIGYQNGSTSQTFTQGGGNTVTQQGGPVYEQRSIGNTLLLTPNINADGTVNIQVLVEESSVQPGGANMLFPTGAGGVTESKPIDVVKEKTFSGSVIAADNKAVAVGGLIQEGADNNENKVPILGDVPGLGFFFGDIGKNRKRTELVIIIKPHIINSPADAEAISKGVLKKNSIHPNAQQADNMDIYSNRDKTLKGYVLEKPYKEYDAQDNFDKYRERGDSREFVNKSGEPNEGEYPQQWQPRPSKPVAPRSGVDPQAQQIYMNLTKYAAKSVKVTPDKWEKIPTIQNNPLRAKTGVNLFANHDIHTIPVASWRQGGINVTAIEVRNNSSQKIQIDHRRLRGQWLASTIEESTLASKNDLGDSTYLYLISAMSFEEALGL